MIVQTQVFDACPAQTKSQVRHLSDDICLLKLRSSMSPNLPSIKKSTRSMKSLAIQELWWLASLPMCLGETNSWFLRNVFFWWHSCQKLAHFHMHYPFVQKLIATNQCQLHKKTPLATINLYSLTKKVPKICWFTAQDTNYTGFWLTLEKTGGSRFDLAWYSFPSLNASLVPETLRK